MADNINQLLETLQGQVGQKALELAQTQDAVSNANANIREQSGRINIIATKIADGIKNMGNITNQKDQASAKIVEEIQKALGDLRVESGTLTEATDLLDKSVEDLDKAASFGSGDNSPGSDYVPGHIEGPESSQVLKTGGRRRGGKKGGYKYKTHKKRHTKRPSRKSRHTRR
jgi:hypothetical protein